MGRKVAAFAAGLVAWFVIATIVNWGLRLWFAGYAAAEPVLAFTLAMKIARLAMAAAASLAAGALVRVIAPTSLWMPWIVGIVLLALFVPVHVGLWARFPVWYHLTFLVTLAPLAAAGARLAGRLPNRQGSV